MGVGFLPQIVELAKKFKAQEKSCRYGYFGGCFGRGEIGGLSKLLKASLSIPSTTCLNHGRDLSKLKYPLVLNGFMALRPKMFFC